MDSLETTNDKQEEQNSLTWLLRDEWESRIEKFDTCNEDKLVEMRNEATEYAKDLFLRKDKGKGRLLSLIGNSGTGKTFLAEQIFQYAKKNLFHSEELRRVSSEMNGFYRGFMFIDCLDLSDKLKDFQTKENYLERIRYAYLVVLDDLFSVHDKSGYYASEIIRILNHRRNKFTIITDNNSMRQIADIERRVASRLIRDDAKFVDVGETTDYNLRKYIK